MSAREQGSATLVPLLALGAVIPVTIAALRKRRSDAIGRRLGDVLATCGVVPVSTLTTALARQLIVGTLRAADEPVGVLPAGGWRSPRAVRPLRDGVGGPLPVALAAGIPNSMTPAQRNRQFAEAYASRRGRKREVKSLWARVEQLERERAAVEAFAAMAAHELVEPLVMTEAYATMVSDRLDADQHADSRRDLDALGRGAARMRLLVETLLHDARTSGREVEREPVDLNRLVAECLALLAPEVAARGARVSVGVLPRVDGEEALLSGLFANLLINALKYSPRQSPVIEVRAARDGSLWRFEVQSNAPTIPAADRERIFEPFHRGTGERRAFGAGLGLTTCRRIVERHGGEIGVRPANGSGNVFHFTLPVAMTLTVRER